MEKITDNLTAIILTASSTALFTWLGNVYFEYKKRKRQRTVILKAISTELNCFNTQQLKNILLFFKKKNEKKDFFCMATKRAFFPVYENNAALVSLVANKTVISKIVECYNSVYAFLDYLDEITNNATESRRIVYSTDSLERPLVRSKLFEKHVEMIEEALLFGSLLEKSIQETVTIISREI